MVHKEFQNETNTSGEISEDEQKLVIEKILELARVSFAGPFNPNELIDSDFSTDDTYEGHWTFKIPEGISFRTVFDSSGEPYTINEVSDTITVCNSFFHVFKPILAGLPSSKADVQMIFKSEFEDHLFDEAISKLTKNPNKGQNNFEIATYCLEEVRGHLQRLMNLAVNESQSEHYSMIVVGKDYEPFGPEIMKAINAQVEQAPQDEPPAQEPEAK